MDLSDAESVDMLGRGHILVDRAGRMAFGAVEVGLDCRYAADSAHFTFAGHDEMTEVCGDGDASLATDRTITDEIRFHLRDEPSFIARRW